MTTSCCGTLGLKHSIGSVSCSRSLWNDWKVLSCQRVMVWTVGLAEHPDLLPSTLRKWHYIMTFPAEWGDTGVHLRDCMNQKSSACWVYTGIKAGLDPKSQQSHLCMRDLMFSGSKRTSGLSDNGRRGMVALNHEWSLKCFAGIRNIYILALKGMIQLLIKISKMASHQSFNP